MDLTGSRRLNVDVEIDKAVDRHVKTQRTPKVKKAWIFGMRRTRASLAKGEIIFLVFGILSILICISLTVERLVYLSPSRCPHLSPEQVQAATDDAVKKCEAESTFAFLILVTCCFCAYHVLHGVYWERSSELFSLCFAVAILLTYCCADLIITLQENMVINQQNGIKLGRMVALVVFGVPLFILAACLMRKYHRRSSFVDELTLSHNEEIKRQVELRFFVDAALMIDLQLTVTMLCMILYNNGDFSLGVVECPMVGAIFAFAITWRFWVYWSIREEHKVHTKLAFGTCWIEPAYVIYKIVRSAMTVADENLAFTSLSLHVTIFIGGFLSIVVRVVLVAALTKAYKTFGEGYNERFRNARSPEPLMRSGINNSDSAN